MRSSHGRENWPRVEATVASDYIAGRHVVPVAFVHPVTGQLVDVDVVVVNDSSLPQPGGRLTIAADPANPDSAVVPGDGDDLQEIVVGWIAMIGAAVAAAAARWVAIARTERLIRTSRPSFAMLAALSSKGNFRYQVQCSLYALDAAPGAAPVCTFLVLTSGGLPVDGPAFPIDVRGRPLPGGLLVARAGDHIIRPVRRPLTRGRQPRPAALTDALQPMPHVIAPAREAIRTAPLWRCLDVFAIVGLISALALTALSVPRMLVGIDRVERLQQHGQAVLVQLQSKTETTLTVLYQPPTGAPLVLATDGSEERTIGRLYPAHLDASNHVRLDADPYDWGLPVVLMVLWWGFTALLVWPAIRWWRDARRAARRGPWYRVQARFDGPNLLAMPPETAEGGHIATGRAHPPRAGWFSCEIAGDLDPGEAFALAGPCASTGRAWRGPNG
ncbi:MAG TPA: hypothetical protein VHQ23_10080 [Ilumatobacteraceae bacterium]|nr:hypothetical protein [Ilumatobacteraceae bacterium]